MVSNYRTFINVLHSEILPVPWEPFQIFSFCLIAAQRCQFNITRKVIHYQNNGILVE